MASLAELLLRVSMCLCLVILVAFVAAGLGLFEGSESNADAPQAQAAGLRWVGLGTADTPRRDGDEWEVDVTRPNGSLVEVTIGDDLELRGFDEELGPHSRRARDELSGAARKRAIAAARAAVGHGRAFSVEREAGDSIEVNLRRGHGAVEVQLDSGQVVEVSPESLDDE